MVAGDARQPQTHGAGAGQPLHHRDELDEPRPLVAQEAVSLERMPGSAQPSSPTPSSTARIVFARSVRR